MLPTEENYVKVDPVVLQSLIDNLKIKISPSEIDWNVKLFGLPPIQENLAFEALMIKCNKKEIRENEFIDFLFRYCAIYTMRYGELLPQNFQSMSKEELVEFFLKRTMDVSETARSSLHKGDIYAGEMGEILLFLLLESKGITQLLNKMSLKTSSNEAVKGLDGIHVGTRGNDILLYLCQSKMEKAYDDTVRDALADVQKYVDDPKREAHEFRLVKSDIDKEKFGNQHVAISHLLSPYYRDAQNLDRVHTLFLAYDWNTLSTLDPISLSDFTSHLEPMYVPEGAAKADYIKGKINANTKLSGKNYLIFMLPLRSLEDLRKKWNNKIGAIIQPKKPKQTKKKVKKNVT